MADQRPGSYARQIDPDGSIKGPDLTAAFDKALDQKPAPEPAQAPPSLHSAQVTKTNLSPRQPAPPGAYDQAKASQHIDAMQADDKAVKAAAIAEKVKQFSEENARRKAKGPRSLGKDFGRGRERGDD